MKVHQTTYLFNFIASDCTFDKSILHDKNFHVEIYLGSIPKMIWCNFTFIVNKIYIKFIINFKVNRARYTLEKLEPKYYFGIYNGHRL